MPCFGIVKGKKFAYVYPSIITATGAPRCSSRSAVSEEQAMLIDSDESRYFRPAYFGDGWIGIRLDLGDNDWEHIGEWILKSWRSVAPARLLRLEDAAAQF